MTHEIINQTPIDRYTAVHFLFGMGMYKFKFAPYQAVFSAVSFELIEDVLKRRYPDTFPHPVIDSKQNALVDVLATLAGYAAARQITNKM